MFVDYSHIKINTQKKQAIQIIINRQTQKSRGMVTWRGFDPQSNKDPT
jgi:hypothetical protein